MEKKITTFTIEKTDDNFYANGRHQCMVKISVLKQEYKNGDWVKLALSDAEKRSIQVAALSDSLIYDQLKMPSGWTTTDARNKYDLGLLNGVYSADIFTEEPVINRAGDCCTNENYQNSVKSVPEIIYCYVSSNRTSTEYLMAKMTFEDTNGKRTLTTNMSVGDEVFDSKILLKAIAPYAINANQLHESTNILFDKTEEPTKSDTHHQTINLYRWTLPYHLRILEGNDRTVNNIYVLGKSSSDDRFLTRARVFKRGTSYVNARNDMSGGCVMDYSYDVTVPDTQLAAEVLHVTGCSWTTGYVDGYHDVTIIDNYGCQHKFRISSVNIGRALSIARIS
ncbi:hypothetical protein GPY51_14565 [Photorhabdus laumondii subsp. laumondii]|nr:MULTISPECIES: hypothetical protein [Photorhabdus]AWK42001.1 hypothetical protein A4R40_11130 [Photorhabdus laumondii subsp. laumondii]AXG42862.1 hypothetical protein PluDJC_11800 [Photorhabdus laumondii subsp. laumondii]AXG47325.1 hypothetical protein PluTT01m_11460 [Photorhabdus laumondii subsp. laumondii]KTL63639.1 hypothetical protein AA106_22950 [Photorhabdus laumondii subsp. laumondii]MCC8383810.1 hypothetical protein [Photorhabdus laumondii]